LEEKLLIIWHIREKEIPPNGDESSSEGEEIPKGWDVKPDI